MPFAVEDDSGEAWVDPAGSDWIVLEEDDVGEIGGFLKRPWPEEERRRLIALLK